VSLRERQGSWSINLCGSGNFDSNTAQQFRVKIQQIMAKIAKPKKKAPSLHSRAARRAESPSLNTDKSLKSVKPPSSNPHVHIFSAQNAGIRKKKSKPLKRGQRLRQQKGIERADIVKEQIDTKLKKSMGKLKTIKDRRKDWLALNEKLESNGETRTVAKGKFAALDDEMWEDEGEGENKLDEGLEGGAVLKPGAVVALPIHQAPADIPLPPAAEDEIDEIL